MRDEKEFTDVTLACEDCQLGEAHKMILAGPSPKKPPNPLIWAGWFLFNQKISITLKIPTQDVSFPLGHQPSRADDCILVIYWHNLVACGPHKELLSKLTKCHNLGKVALPLETFETTRSSLMLPWPARMVSWWKPTRWSWLAPVPKQPSTPLGFSCWGFCLFPR